MLNLSKIIKESLKQKDEVLRPSQDGEQSQNINDKSKEEPAETAVAETSPLPSPEPAPVVETTTHTVNDDTKAPVEEETPPPKKTNKKEKISADEETLALARKEIESLEMKIDEDDKVYKFGGLVSVSFKELKDCNPVMAANKTHDAVQETLLKKYDIEPEELEKLLEDFKKKFRAFGTHCYIHILKQKL